MIGLKTTQEIIMEEYGIDLKDDNAMMEFAPKYRAGEYEAGSTELLTAAQDDNAHIIIASVLQDTDVLAVSGIFPNDNPRDDTTLRYYKGGVLTKAQAQERMIVCSNGSVINPYLAQRLQHFNPIAESESKILQGVKSDHCEQVTIVTNPDLVFALGKENKDDDLHAAIQASVVTDLAQEIERAEHENEISAAANLSLQSELNIEPLVQEDVPAPVDSNLSVAESGIDMQSPGTLINQELDKGSTEHRESASVGDFISVPADNTLSIDSILEDSLNSSITELETTNNKTQLTDERINEYWSAKVASRFHLAWACWTSLQLKSKKAIEQSVRKLAHDVFMYYYLLLHCNNR